MGGLPPGKKYILIPARAKLQPGTGLSGSFLLPKGLLSLHFEAGFDLVTSGFDLVTFVLLHSSLHPPRSREVHTSRDLSGGFYPPSSLTIVLHSSLHLTGGQAEFLFEHGGKILLVAETHPHGNLAHQALPVAEHGICPVEAVVFNKIGGGAAGDGLQFSMQLHPADVHFTGKVFHAQSLVGEVLLYQQGKFFQKLPVGA